VAKGSEGRILTPTKPEMPLDLQHGSIADSGRGSFNWPAARLIRACPRPAAGRELYGGVFGGRRLQHWGRKRGEDDGWATCNVLDKCGSRVAATNMHHEASIPYFLWHDNRMWQLLEQYFLPRGAAHDSF
jgi:hypothetical protein